MTAPTASNSGPASEPTSVEGIEKYLASGMIRGDVDGIGPVRASRIVAAWAEQKPVREIMVFLHSHGVGTARAVRIFKTYGADAIQVMSFVSCDELGASLRRSVEADFTQQVRLNHDAASVERSIVDHQQHQTSGYSRRKKREVEARGHGPIDVHHCDRHQHQ